MITDSPDLALADFFLFPRLNAAIKGERFADMNAIKGRVTVNLRSIPQEAFTDCFRKLYERCQTCVVADGHYFKGNIENLFVSLQWRLVNTCQVCNLISVVLIIIISLLVLFLF